MWGIGLTGGGSAEFITPLLVVGTATTGSSGAGYFWNSTNIINGKKGAFASLGTYSGIPGYQLEYPINQSGFNKIGYGSYAGVGGGLFVTNASCVEDLRGISKTYSANLPWLSLQYNSSNGTFIFSGTIGPSSGFSFSSYNTNTWVK